MVPASKLSHIHLEYSLAVEGKGSLNPVVRSMSLLPHKKEFKVETERFSETVILLKQKYTLKKEAMANPENETPW